MPPSENVSRRRSPEHYRRISLMGVQARLARKKPRDMKAWLMERSTIVESGCREWGRYIHPSGYGATKIHGISGLSFAHRLSYAAFIGLIPVNGHVLHRCDNPKCINPDHLFIGDQSKNNQDRDAKGRQAIAERIRTTKLTKAQVVEIRRRWPLGKITKTNLAREFSITVQNLKAVITHKTWKHL